MTLFFYKNEETGNERSRGIRVFEDDSEVRIRQVGTGGLGFVRKRSVMLAYALDVLFRLNRL